MPIVTLVDTAGRLPGHRRRGARPVERDRRVDHARCRGCRCPIVTIVTGEGGSGGALALGAADRVLMLENSYYSVISPEGCATILFKDAAAAPRAAGALRMTAPDLLRLGIVDAVVPEPAEGAHTDHPATAANLKRAIVDSLRELLRPVHRRAARAALRPLPRVRRARSPAGTSADPHRRAHERRQEA